MPKNAVTPLLMRQSPKIYAKLLITLLPEARLNYPLYSCIPSRAVANEAALVPCTQESELSLALRRGVMNGLNSELKPHSYIYTSNVKTAH